MLDRVAFYSDATNLSPGDNNGRSDVFVHDRTADTTTRVSDGLEDVEGDGTSDLPAISGNGRYVAFESTSANLVGDDTNRHSDVFIHDLVAGPEPLFALSDLSASPSRARPGATIRVTARIKNVGEETGTYTALLLVAAETEQQRSVTVRAGKEARVQFTVHREATGTYTLELGPLTGRFTVRK
ncbi:CARDB domain-containing protein [Streptomyces sp. NPDC005146]